MTSQYKAVFFDLDGTLRIPSPSPTEAFVQFARSEIGSIDDETARRLKIWAHRYWGGDVSIQKEMERLGENSFWVNYSQQMLEMVRLTDNLQANARRVRKWFDSEYAPEVRLAAGAIELFTELKSTDTILGVISNRPQPFHDVLAELEISDWFDITLAAGEVGHWKPNRAVFDHALTFFNGLAAADCLYIGDNYFADGIGANNAGMVPVIYDPDGLYGNMTFCCIDDLRQVTAVFNNGVKR